MGGRPLVVAVLVAAVLVVAAGLLTRAGDAEERSRTIGVAPETFARVASGVALVQALDCLGRPLRVQGHTLSGTGFLVGSRVLLTAEHGVWVAPNQRACGFRGRLGDRWYEITDVRVWRDPGSDDFRGIDLATMTLAREASGHIFKIARQSPPIGSEVAALGYPLGLPLSLSHGVVLKKPKDNGKPALAAQIVVEGGNSGGPIIDREGQAVGVVRVSLSRVKATPGVCTEAWTSPAGGEHQRVTTCAGPAPTMGFRTATMRPPARRRRCRSPFPAPIERRAAAHQGTVSGSRAAHFRVLAR